MTFPYHDDIFGVRRQQTTCPECGSKTAIKQIADWGVCEECRRKAEENENNDTK